MKERALKEAERTWAWRKSVRVKRRVVREWWVFGMRRREREKREIAIKMKRIRDVKREYLKGWFEKFRD